ncbi:MAG TPA: hypothetical protein VL147_18520 [Devosia sp.]|nr:hypothetical protein [Devosia sp.]
MAPKFSFKAGRVVVADDARTVLDTAAKSFNAVPTAVITINPFTLAFPDFANKGYTYLWGRGSIPNDAQDRAYEVCRTLAHVHPQETVLPNVDLGAVPAGTDYLETRINLTRTLSPPNSWGSINPVVAGLKPWPSEIVNGQWMSLLGNSAVAERDDNWARAFDIVIIAGRAVLRRRQSVGAGGFDTGQLEAKADIANEVAPPSLQEGNGGHCSFVNSYNYASTYSGVIEITPCSYRSGL